LAQIAHKLEESDLRRVVFFWNRYEFFDEPDQNRNRNHEDILAIWYQQAGFIDVLRERIGLDPDIDWIKDGTYIRRPSDEVTLPEPTAPTQ